MKTNKLAPHILIWDLGNTLIRSNTYAFARIIGLTDFILYPLLEQKNPKKIDSIVFSLLSQINGHHEGYPSATAQGKTLPAILCQWLAGTIDHHSLTEKVKACEHLWVQQKCFSSKRQQRLVTNTIKAMLDPRKLARCMKPIPQAIRLLKECAELKDADGHKKNQLYILSNWDKESFKHLKNAPSMESLFHYFDTRHIVISADIGLIKPQPAIYDYFLKKYNLDPKNCVLIDDQIENITAAEKEGITGLQIQNGNYTQLKLQLKALGAL